MATGCFLKIPGNIRMHNSSGPHGSMGFWGVEGGAGRSALQCNMISVFPTRGLRSSSTGTITTHSASRYGHIHIFINLHQDKFCPHRITDRRTKNWSITYDRFLIKYLNIEHFCHCFEVVILKLLLRGTDAVLWDSCPLCGTVANILSCLIVPHHVVFSTAWSFKLSTSISPQWHCPGGLFNRDDFLKVKSKLISYCWTSNHCTHKQVKWLIELLQL